jgi:hypothetical protein
MNNYPMPLEFKVYAVEFECLESIFDSALDDLWCALLHCGVSYSDVMYSLILSSICR